MSRDPDAEAAAALHRFGLGPRAGSIAAIASDPRGALISELERPGAGLIEASGRMTSGEAGRAAFSFRQAQQTARLARRAERDANSSTGPATTPTEQMPSQGLPGDRSPGAGSGAMEARPAPGGSGDAAPPQAPVRTQGPSLPQQIYLDEARARMDAALTADLGFAERLVWFWSNHFCVSADKAGVRPLAGAYEREAIRAQVLGRFADMLLAVESHPAMLIYLDNARSIGPDSLAGIFRRRGLNENLAREILELHTLGVRSVYSQEDVTSFANVITGWTIIPPRQDPARGSEFNFNPRMHQPGAQKVLDKVYPDTGVEQGRAVLADLARHPATAKHIAHKFARHFVADQPPPALVERLTRSFRDTDGNLKELAKTLVASSEAWSAPRAKIKRPSEWIVGTLRAIGATPQDVRRVLGAQNLLGEPLWRPPAPKGFSDENPAWVDGLPQRLDIANQIARRIDGLAEPAQVAETALGPLLSRDTQQAIARAESRPQALTLVLMAPEFQRR